MAGKASKGKARRSGKGATKKTTGSSKAGLIFPVGRCTTLIKKGRYAQRLSSGTGAFMAAVLEYLAIEILELAGNAAQEAKKKTITPRHLQLALGNDEELNKMLASTTISSGGVVPSIQEALFPKKGKKARTAQEN